MYWISRFAYVTIYYNPIHPQRENQTHLHTRLTLVIDASVDRYNRELRRSSISSEVSQKFCHVGLACKLSLVPGDAELILGRRLRQIRQRVIQHS